ncbi:unnamed protein product, partial [Brassica oleracea]
QGRFIKTRIVEILKLLKYFVHIATVSLVIGSVLAIKHITHIFPEIEKQISNQLRCVLTQCDTNIFIILFSMGLSRKIPRSLSMKIWISSTAKLTLHVLGANFTASRWMQEPSSGYQMGLCTR